MLCPICKSELIVTGQAQLETLDEHVCNPNGEVSFKNKFECSSPICQSHGKIIWNEWGELYHQEGCSFNEKFNFVDNNDAPFGSFQRCCNVEIYKHDEDFCLCKILGRQVWVRYHYKSNENGDILKRWWKFEIITKDGTVYMSGWRMLLYSIRKFHQNLNRLNNNEDHEDYGDRFYKEYLELSDWKKKDWWRRLAVWYARTYCFLAGV
jgi:hypothetical protein